MLWLKVYEILLFAFQRIRGESVRGLRSHVSQWMGPAIEPKPSDALSFLLDTVRVVACWRRNSALHLDDVCLEHC